MPPSTVLHPQALLREAGDSSQAGKVTSCGVLPGEPSFSKSFSARTCPRHAGTGAHFWMNFPVSWHLSFVIWGTVRPHAPQEAPLRHVMWKPKDWLKVPRLTWKLFCSLKAESKTQQLKDAKPDPSLKGAGPSMALAGEGAAGRTS